MSLSGKLSDEEMSEFGFRTMKVCCSNHLNIQFDSCIVQPIVTELLHLETEPPGPNCKFFLTDSPFSDVSDVLLDLDDVDEPRAHLAETLRRLWSVLKALHEMKCVSNVRLVFSEGFDQRFDRIVTTVGSFEADCLKFYDRRNEFNVSLSVEISERSE
jgi:hypothetical protein